MIDWFRIVSFGCTLLALIVATGCNPVIDQSPPPREVFYGRFILIKDPYVIGQSDTDQVEFVVQGGTYSFHHLTHDTRLCDTKGNALAFGGNRVNLVPITIFSGNCDTSRVPRGYFDTAFKGDSLTLSKFDTARTLWYQINLTK